MEKLPQILRSVWAVAGIATFIKVLLIPSYYSTDFEVHRHWLAITNSLPPYEWYFDTTSEWTLDYPPLFAWFEKALGSFLTAIAPLQAQEFMTLSPTPISPSTTQLYLHRLTVILFDFVLLAAIVLYTRTWSSSSTSTRQKSTDDDTKAYTAIWVAFLNAGLLMVDHIHFQYNGGMLGLLIASVAFIRLESDVAAAAIFATLLMMKHIYLYVSLLYFVYLLRHYCWNQRLSVQRLCTLALVVLVIFGLSVASVIPWTEILHHGNSPVLIVVNTLKQIISRLFPVAKRGLLHAYWAPNVWALYALFDKVILLALKFVKSPILLPKAATSSLSLGLVQEAQFAILPSVPAFVTVLLTLVAMAPVLRDVWRQPHPGIFMSALVYCMLTSFMLGYHVHEKAILQVVLPMAMQSVESGPDGKLYMLLAMTGNVSLFPLLYTPGERVTRLLITLSCDAVAALMLYSSLRQSRVNRRIKTTNLWALSKFETGYVGGLLMWAVVSSTAIVNTSFFTQRWPFLCRLITSVYCAVGMVYCWRQSYVQHKRKLQLIQSSE